LPLVSACSLRIRATKTQRRKICAPQKHLIVVAALVAMAPTHSIAFCNNRGGAGKTFMAFQVACEAARARPGKKVLVIDFSLYADITQLLLGGGAAGEDGVSKGARETIKLAPTMDTRVEGLIRDLEQAMDVDDLSTAAPAVSNSFFGQLFGRRESTAPTQVPSGPVDLTKYAIRPYDANEAIPSNLYLIPSAGEISWDPETTSTGAEIDVPLWMRKGDEWAPASRRLAAAADALHEDFDAIFVDTDHLASCVLTKMALAMCDSVVVPLSLNDQDFNRLYKDLTLNALFTDVMAPMLQKSQLRARVHRMVFTRVSPNGNTPEVTRGYIKSPFKPTKAAMSQMDILAGKAQTVCRSHNSYKELFKGVDALADTIQAFNDEYFSAMKSMPDLAASISMNSGVPLCNMTTQTYIADSGLEGRSDGNALKAIKAEMLALVQSITSEEYSEPNLV
jgi:cellulose biosynthesis protein BcsQ